jgi:hypothetical protein
VPLLADELQTVHVLLKSVSNVGLCLEIVSALCLRGVRTETPVPLEFLRIVARWC